MHTRGPSLGCETVITLPRSLCLEDLEDICTALAKVPDRPGQSIALDTSGVSAVSPAGLVLIEAATVALTSSRLTIDGRVSSMASDEQQMELPLWGGPISGRVVVGNCHQFSDETSADRTAEALTLSLGQVTSADSSFRSSIHQLVGEVTRNVVHHASTFRGFAAAWPLSDELLELAVCDRGVGIRRTLRRAPERAKIDDRRALELAVSPQISGESIGTGLGLFYVQRVVNENGGSLWLRSGSAALESHPNGNPAAIDGLQSLRGTLVALQIRLDRPFDYDLLEEALAAPAGVESRLTAR